MHRVTVTLDDELMAELDIRHDRVVVIPAEPRGGSGQGRERMFHRHA